MILNRMFEWFDETLTWTDTCSQEGSQEYEAQQIVSSR